MDVLVIVQLSNFGNAKENHQCVRSVEMDEWILTMVKYVMMRTKQMVMDALPHAWLRINGSVNRLKDKHQSVERNVEMANISVQKKDVMMETKQIMMDALPHAWLRTNGSVTQLKDKHQNAGNVGMEF